MKKTIWIILVILLVAVVAVSVLVSVDEPETQTESLLFLAVEDFDDDSFYGVDSEGKRWLIHGECDRFYAVTWVRFTGKPVELTDVQHNGQPVDYEVTASRVWYRMYHAKAGGQYEASDVCQFDIDGDGTVEECIISPEYDTIGSTNYQLAVWDGDNFEIATDIYTSGSADALAFAVIDGELKIIGVDWPYGSDTWQMRTYNITYQGGRLTVSQLND